MSLKTSSSVDKDDVATPDTPLLKTTEQNGPQLNQIDRNLRSTEKRYNNKKYKIDTDSTPEITLDKDFKFKNNFGKLPIITTETTIMIPAPAKKIDKGKAKESVSPAPTAPIPPKFPKTPSAPTMPKPLQHKPENNAKFDANHPKPKISNQNSGKTPTEKIISNNAPDNTSENAFSVISRQTKFALSADPKDIAGNTNREKEASTDALYNELEGYEGSRTIVHRKRKLILAYFKNGPALTTATTTMLAQQKNFPFKIFNEKEIENEIAAQRDTEKQRTIRVTNIPHCYNYDTLYKFFADHGKIDRLNLINKPVHNIAYIVYADQEAANKFEDTWFLYLEKDTIRITPLFNDPEEMKTRDLHILKLAGLPTYTYAKDIEEIVLNLKGKHCFIPRNKSDRPCNYAYIRFANAEDKANAQMKVDLKFKERPLFISNEDAKSCYNCGNPKHELIKCDKPRLMYQAAAGNNYRTAKNNYSSTTFSYDRYGPNPYLNEEGGDNMDMDTHSGPSKRRNNNPYNQYSYANVVKGSRRNNLKPHTNTNYNSNSLNSGLTPQDSENMHSGLKDLAESIKSLAQEIKECNEDMRVMTIAMSNLNSRISTLEELWDETDPEENLGELTPKEGGPTEMIIEKPIDPRMILNTDFTTVQNPTKGSIFEREIEHLKTDSKYITDRQDKLASTMGTINSMINGISKFFPGSKSADQSTAPNVNNKPYSTNTQNPHEKAPNCLAEQSTSASGSK